MNQDHIRNFAIIAHIDHGKSTLADRLLEMTGTVAKRDMQEQILDSNPIERERGITIKLAPVRMMYTSSSLRSARGDIQEGVRDSYLVSGEEKDKTQIRDTSTYILNLIDTPGHVDFGYEVSRSLAACEGAILVVDATQGVQAQTLANLAAAREHKLTVIPVINKIDMPNARIEVTRDELCGMGFKKEDIINISAKTGENVEKVLEMIVESIPPPKGNPHAPLRALVFSSQYDAHKGVVVFVRVIDGAYQYDIHNSIRFLASNASVTPIEAGFFTPHMQKSTGLATGEVGYIATGLKDVRFAKVGDTITTMPNDKCQMSKEKQKFSIGHWPFSITPLAGYREPKPMVFVSLFPLAANEFTQAREAMEKLRLSDSAFTFRPISSLALGNGFHCGFLGLLHAEIVQERLSREFNLNMIATAPSVEYHLTLKPGVNPGKIGFTESSLINRKSGSEIRKAKFETRDTKLENSQVQNLSNPESRIPNPDIVAIQSAAEFPDPTVIEAVKEPIMRVTIFTPSTYVGAIMQLAQGKRGDYLDMKYLHGAFSTSEVKEVSTSEVSGNDRVMVEMEYLMPLSEMIVDFFDRLKSISEGYASLDYEFFDGSTALTINPEQRRRVEYQPVQLVKIDILVNHEKVDALSFLAVQAQARHRAIAIVERLAQVIPRQQFTIPIQGAIGGSPRSSSGGAGQIIARADVKPFRKDVIAKLYGGDRTRKDKLLEAQKRGKARMKRVGSVDIPQSAFFEVLKRD